MQLAPCSGVRTGLTLAPDLRGKLVKVQCGPATVSAATFWEGISTECVHEPEHPTVPLHKACRVE